jgi:cysteine desulfurase
MRGRPGPPHPARAGRGPTRRRRPGGGGVTRAYLDHASTSPLRPGVAEAMTPWLSSADPGRLHTEGRLARAALEDARATVAAALGTRPRQVIFTSGATESIHAATYGALGGVTGGASRVVCSAVEHAAVRDASVDLAGAVVPAPVDAEGRIDVDGVLDAIGPATALVHCQWANQEVGALQPVREVVAVCRERGVTVHVDAASAAGRVPIAFDDLGADLLSLSAHKLGGPRGIGVLLVRRGRRFTPLLAGGAQERARRAGMEATPLAVGFAAAWAALDAAGGAGAEAAVARRHVDRLRAAALAIPDVTALGPADPDERLAHLLCVDVAGVEAEGVLLGLDQAGVAAHSGSACSSELLEPSPVLAAMGVPAERSLRFSAGWSTTDEEVDLACRALPEVVGRLRALAGAG